MAILLALLGAGVLAMVRTAPVAEDMADTAPSSAPVTSDDPTPPPASHVLNSPLANTVLIVGSESEADALRAMLADGGLMGVRASRVSVVVLSGSESEEHAFRSMVLGNNAVCGACGAATLIDLRGAAATSPVEE